MGRYGVGDRVRMFSQSTESSSWRYHVFFEYRAQYAMGLLLSSGNFKSSNVCMRKQGRQCSLSSISDLLSSSPSVGMRCDAVARNGGVVAAAAG